MLVVFMFFLILAVALLANPLRHFEVYLGQWSISGPGRAFRIIPMLDGKQHYNYLSLSGVRYFYDRSFIYFFFFTNIPSIVTFLNFY